MSNGKGDQRRPRLVPRAQYDENWNAVFYPNNEEWPQDSAQGKEFPNEEEEHESSRPDSDSE